MKNWRRGVIALCGALLGASSLHAQDTTASYPWRLSYFPYLTAAPYDGAMLTGRVVLFQQSRWDDRTSIDRQVAFDGGYSTADAWLLRIRADMPHLAPGWRLQAEVEADRTNYVQLATFGFPPTGFDATPDNRQSASIEITRWIIGRFGIAARGTWSRLQEVDVSDPDFTQPPETDTRARVALVFDGRDREYDTRRGILLQGGLIASPTGTGYHGVYAQANGWLPLGDATRFTARAGFRNYNVTGGGTLDAWREMPAWEDAYLVGGGPESSRALAPGYLAGRRVELASIEGRHDLIVFPGGAVTILAFADGARVDTQNSPAKTGGGPVPLDGPYQDWVVGAGGGVALRLLRNAVLTATLGRAQHITRFYLSSGWSW